LGYNKNKKKVKYEKYEQAAQHQMLARLFNHNSTDGRTEDHFGQNSSRQAHSAHSARAHTLKMQINHVVKLVNLFGCFAFAFAHAHSACEIESLGVGSTFDFIPLDSDSLGRFTSGFFEQQQPKQKNLVGLRYSGVDKLVTGYYNL